MNKLPQRMPLFVVKDLETLKILTEPLHLQILEMLDLEPQTVKQVADKLGLSSNRLYYHFKMLEEHGLIQVVQTRLVNNMLEKTYWGTAEDIDIDKELINFSTESSQETLFKIVSNSIETTHADIMRSLEARKFKLDQGAKTVPRDLVITHTKKRLSDETYQQFVNRIRAILKEFSELQDEEDSGEGVNVFSIACYLYPSYYYNDEQEEENEG